MKLFFNYILIALFLINFSYSQENDYLSDFIESNIDKSPGKPLSVSIIQLITSPEKYDNKVIMIKGFLNLSFEGNALYLNYQDFEYKIFKNAIYLNLDKANSSKLTEECNQKYVSIIGTFKAGLNGHFSSFSGDIFDIRRIDILESRIEYSKH